MRSICFCLAVLLLAPALNGIDAGEPKNGNWWGNRPDTDKLWFVEGYIMGASRGAKLVKEALASKGISLKTAPGDKDVTYYLDFSEISYGQFIQGLDEFYSDYRNKRINVTFALLWVRDSIRGETQPTLEKHLEGMRKATINPDYDKEN